MPEPMKPRERIDYSAIVDRPPLRLPDGGRIAVWTIVNVEEWSIDHPMPRTVLPPPQGKQLLPDLPNWAWHEYGMRVGFWRLIALSPCDVEIGVMVFSVGDLGDRVRKFHSGAKVLE